MLEDFWTSSVKDGEGNGMVWRCLVMVMWGICTDINKFPTLQYHAIPSGWHLIGVHVILQPDNHPKHSSKLYKICLARKQSAGILSASYLGMLQVRSCARNKCP